MALYLLSRVMYFGEIEVRELLRALYRDQFKYPITSQIRRINGNTRDGKLLNRAFDAELRATRFIGVGNPAESGTHLLYFFRQENLLPTNLFIDTDKIFKPLVTGRPREFRTSTVRRYIFIDDFCGSGEQGVRYSRGVVSQIKSTAERSGKRIVVGYYVLIGTDAGLQRIRSHTEFDEVRCAVELDESYKCFGPRSRYFARADVAGYKDTAQEMCRRYGQRLVPEHELGFADCQLLVSMHHNTPDNTVPIIWSDNGWEPIFRRYPKYESPDGTW